MIITNCIIISSSISIITTTTIIGGDGRLGAHGVRPPGPRGNPLSSTTCPAQVFFKSGESYAKL